MLLGPALQELDLIIPVRDESIPGFDAVSKRASFASDVVSSSTVYVIQITATPQGDVGTKSQPKPIMPRVCESSLALRKSVSARIHIQLPSAP